MSRTLLTLLLIVGTLLANAANPPNGKTGRPTEGTCADCHSGPTGSADSTELAGFPTGSYVPDSFYLLTLSVRYAGQTRWGFALTAVNAANTRAGQLVVTDSVNTQYSSVEPGYLKQTSAGTRRGQNGPVTWTFGWRAPAAGTGPVKFYWCANAANNNSSTSGDAICRDSLTVAEWSAIKEPSSAARRVVWQLRNPARDRVTISYDGDATKPVEVYSAAGRLLRRLEPVADHGTLLVTWDGRDQCGRLVPAGNYFVRLGCGINRLLKVQLAR